MVTPMTYLKERMLLGQMHIPLKRDGTSGYNIFCLQCYFCTIKWSLHIIPYLCAEIPLGILARSNPRYSNHSSCPILGSWATSDYSQSLQFQKLNKEKQNIQLVIRGGRREKISIFDIVVGDVVPLKIGDRVPANGILISGHSICIDESSMTGESNLVHKDKKISIFNVWCKIADGAGTMLVTGVGINTEWGLLMASISEDTDEETPLQVCLNGVASFIGIVGLSVAFAVLLVLLVRWPLWFLQFQKDFLWL